MHLYKLKRYAHCMIFALIITLFMFLPVQASNAHSTHPGANSNIESISPRVEQTVWYYRTRNGVRERRLWSLTYGKWLTNWIPA